MTVVVVPDRPVIIAGLYSNTPLVVTPVPPTVPQVVPVFAGPPGPSAPVSSDAGNLIVAGTDAGISVPSSAVAAVAAAQDQVLVYDFDALVQTNLGADL